MRTNFFVPSGIRMGILYRKIVHIWYTTVHIIMILNQILHVSYNNAISTLLFPMCELVLFRNHKNKYIIV